MDNKTKYGSLAEAAAVQYFISKDCEVFTSFGGKGSFDLVVYKDDVLYRVEVKSVLNKNRYNSWDVQIRRVRSNKTQNIVYPFDSDSIDILCIYIVPINKLISIYSDSIKTKSAITLNSAKIKILEDSAGLAGSLP